MFKNVAHENWKWDNQVLESFTNQSYQNFEWLKFKINQDFDKLLKEFNKFLNSST
jgi:hypothetical protein